MRYAVIGAGAIGGTVAAGLIRDGHEVLLCDADPEHVAAINAGGLRIEGPVEQLTVPARAVTPDDLPDRLDAVLLAVKAHHTAAAVEGVAPLSGRRRVRGLAPERLQRGRDRRGGRARAGRRRVRQLRRRCGRAGADPARQPGGAHDRRARRGGHAAGARARGRHRRCPPDGQHPRLPVVEGGLRGDPLCDGGVRPLDRRRAGRAALPAALRCPRARGAGGRDRRPRAVRRLRPGRPRGVDRPAGRVQPGVGQDALAASTAT